MALNATIAGLHIIHSCRIQDVAPRGTLDVVASRTVAFLTANIPFRNLLGADVVVNRMATITRRPGGPLHIIRWIKWHPPVGPICREVGTPHVIGNVPLLWFRKIVLANLGEVTLLPNAAVNERNLIFREI